MNDPKNQIEKLLDENNTEDLILYDEENVETPFAQIAVIPLNERVYAILKPKTEVEGIGEDEALVFVIEEVDDEDCLVVVDDEETVRAVFDVYYALLRAEGLMED